MYWNIYLTMKPIASLGLKSNIKRLAAGTHNAKSPPEQSVLAGSIRYIGFVLEGSGNLYANRP